MKRTEGATLLRERMTEREWNQTALAERIGVQQSSVSMWMRGRSRPEPHHRQALAALLDIPEHAWLTPSEAAVVRRASSREAPRRPAKVA